MLISIVNRNHQTPGILTLHESSGESDSRIRFMCIHRLSGEIASKVAMDPDKCADFTLYLEKYLEALYASDDDLASTYENTLASPELPIINNPIRSKAVGRPKKGRIRSEK